MKLFSKLAAPVLFLASGAAVAQPVPQQSHQQHQATGQHEAAAGGERCCCEEMMRKMMSEMMQKHPDMTPHKGRQPSTTPGDSDHKHPGQ